MITQNVKTKVLTSQLFFFRFGSVGLFFRFGGVRVVVFVRESLIRLPRLLRPNWNHLSCMFWGGAGVVF